MKLMPSQENIMPGTIVLAFDYRKYENDILTPMEKTHKIGIVRARYGIRGCMTGLGKHHENPAIYNESDCVDVEFIEDGYLSKSKFTNGVINLQMPYMQFVKEARFKFTPEFIEMVEKYFIFNAT